MEVPDDSCFMITAIIIMGIADDCAYSVRVLVIYITSNLYGTVPLVVVDNLLSFTYCTFISSISKAIIEYVVIPKYHARHILY